MINYADNIQIDTSKLRKKDLYLYADVVELSCLKNKDSQISLTEALDEQLGNNEGIGGIEQEEDTDDELEQAAQNDKQYTNISDIRNYISARINLFNNLYPFEFNDGIVTLKANINSSHKLYFFMLLASNLAFLKKEERHSFTHDFEIVTAFAVQQFFPHWELRLFGTSSSEQIKNYKGTPRNKIEQLSKETGLRLRIEEPELATLQTPNGDAGLDVVAWFPFNDEASHMPVFLVQAGCTADESQMFAKQYTAIPSKWQNKLEGLEAIGCMVTPQCYRNGVNSWPQKTNVDCVFIDRYRVLHLLALCDDFDIATLKTYDKIENIIPTTTEKVC